MKRMQSRAKFCLILILAFILGLGVFLTNLYLHRNKWTVENYYAAIGYTPISNYDILISYSNTENKQEYTVNGEKYYIRGNLVDRNGLTLGSISENGIEYNTNDSIRIGNLHTIGDKYSYVSTGALRSMAEHFSLLTTEDGKYNSKDTGNIVTLTENAEVSALATKLLGNKQGVVGVYNYRTGEILCVASTPTYDPDNVPADIETNPKYDGAYLNRFMSCTFTPGSSFKTVTLEAAIDNIPDLFNQTFVCNGKTTINGQVLNCTGHHGYQNIYQAYSNSCNCAFAQIAEQLNRSKYLEVVKNGLFTKSTTIDGHLKLEAGSFDILNCKDYEYVWSTIGLHKDLINPCSLMMYIGAVANGGTTAVPTELYKVTDCKGNVLERLSTKYTERIIKKPTADSIKDMMINNTKNSHYGTYRFNVKIGAKTGTIDRPDGGMNGWYTGFVDDDRYPYAFVVYVENGGFGRTTAGDIAAKVINALVENK